MTRSEGFLGLEVSGFFSVFPEVAEQAWIGFNRGIPRVWIRHTIPIPPDTAPFGGEGTHCIYCGVLKKLWLTVYLWFNLHVFVCSTLYTNLIYLF